MPPLIIVFLILLFGSFSYAESAELELLYAKRIAWAAANINDHKVAKSFQSSFQNLLQDPSQLGQLKSPEGQRVLQQGKNLMAVMRLKEKLENCLLSEAAAQSVALSISKAMTLSPLKSESCLELKDEASTWGLPSHELDKATRDEAKNKLLSRARAQLKSTQIYWDDANKKNKIEIAVELTEREWDMKERPPQSGTELLLYTKAVQDRKNKEIVSQTDVKNAFSEIQTELKTNESYLNKVSEQESDEALQSLLVSNPAAAAEFLMENPESLNLVCKTLQDYDNKIKRKATLKNVMFWGGIVVAGTLLATGIGGLVVLSGTAAASTLTTVAAGAAIVGGVSAGGEALYSSSETYGLFAEAQNLRSSAFAEGLPQGALSKADQAKAQAYSELADAGFSAVSIIPFGAGIKYVKNITQASRLGSISRVAAEGSKVETEAVRSIAQTLKEISSDQKVLKTLEMAQKVVKDDEMAKFLGYFSDLELSEKQKILELIKAQPDKVPEAIHSSAKAGACR